MPYYAHDSVGTLLEVNKVHLILQTTKDSMPPFHQQQIKL